ncbi:PURINE-RICH BINDING PROTEIN-ALPHA ISOFORM B [Salix koriyanagi]|uniref:PURINE-RICH BINDING PROTEIN-ALPHA ISOFORM B n=1 Tax=Salix koriyanagi TaxID=2511006 RepID=A0A9Q0SYB5_9ROSI|nr:PURINE-RICH BINDING PROTEIN-ALPHA ISOFORM B [Salix koriyanagi]
MEGNSGGVGGGGSGSGAGGGGGSGGGGGGGNDVELMCKTLQVEHKLFYFDLKENPRGRYLKISEKTSATSKELQLDTKVFYFDIGENRRGRFLKKFTYLG